MKQKQKDNSLLPCPFCGGEAVINDLGSDRFHIHCVSCPAQFGQAWSVAEDKEFLAKGWNTRTLKDKAAVN